MVKWFPFRPSARAICVYFAGAATMYHSLSALSTLSDRVEKETDRLAFVDEKVETGGGGHDLDQDDSFSSSDDDTTAPVSTKWPQVLGSGSSCVIISERGLSAILRPSYHVVRRNV